ncbi:MAG: hypothetical protein M3Q24_00015 [bacterium]|nr:hypothetical protein [bacterium]
MKLNFKNNVLKIVPIGVIMFVLYPQNSYAAFTGIKGIIDDVGEIIGTLTVIAAAAALLVFFYGLVKFILKAGQEKAEGKGIMVWGLIALFVMLSVWGIIRFFQAEFGLDQDANVIQIQTITGGSVNNRPDNDTTNKTPNPFDIGKPNCGTDSLGNPIATC